LSSVVNRGYGLKIDQFVTAPEVLCSVAEK
jgi:hypothetical protein